MRIKLLFALSLMLLFCCAACKSNAQMPEDIAALAALQSRDYYYQSNVPFSMRVADSLEMRVNQIRSTVELDLEDIAGELGAARKSLFHLDAAKFAIESRLLIADAIAEVDARWQDQEEVMDDFSVERFRSNFSKARRSYSLEELEEMSEEPRQFIDEAWDEFGKPYLKKMTVESLENPVNLKIGLVQDVGYALLTNTMEETLKNAIVVINYEATNGEDGRSDSLIYYFPELEPEKSVAILSIPPFPIPSAASENNQRKFNAPFKDESIKMSFDVYSENGKCLEMQPEINDGLRTQMDCLRAIFVRGAAFGSAKGDGLTIKKVSGSGRTLKVFFDDLGKASINNAWKSEDRDDSFEPRSTAFRFRISTEEDSDDRDPDKGAAPIKRGENGKEKEMETGVPYTWRAGSLIMEPAFGRGGPVLYPIER